MSRNTTRVTVPPRAAVRAYRPGNDTPTAISHPESRSVLAEGDAKRAESHRDEVRGHAAFNAERASLERSEGDSGAAGRDAANPKGGVGDYLSST